MTRASTFVLFLVPLAALGQTSKVWMLSGRAATCGPIRMMARMDTLSITTLSHNPSAEWRRDSQSATSHRCGRD